MSPLCIVFNISMFQILIYHLYFSVVQMFLGFQYLYFNRHRVNNLYQSLLKLYSKKSINHVLNLF